MALNDSIWTVKTETIKDEIKIPLLDLSEAPGEMELAIPSKINQSVKNLVEEIKGSNKKVSEYAKLAMDFIAAAEKGLDHLNSNRGFFKRILKGITGSTHNKSLQSKQDLANAQKACVQMVAEMNNQMLLGQEQILMLENILHYMISEENEFRRMLKERLQNIFSAVKVRFGMIENTINETITEVRKLKNVQNFHQAVLENVDKKLSAHSINIKILFSNADFLLNYIIKVENEVRTLKWLTKLKSYDNPYENIQTPIEKFFYAIFEFYREKQGEFTYEDLLIFSTGLKELGFDFNEKKTIRSFLADFIKSFMENEKYKYFHKKFEFIDDIEKLNYFQSEDNKKSPFITALNFCTHAMKNAKVLNVAVDESLNNLYELQINPSAELNWFLMASEILSYLKAIDNPNEDTSSEKDWEYLLKDLKKGKPIDQLQFDLKKLLYKPLLKDLDASILPEDKERMKKHNFIGLLNLLQKRNLAEMEIVDDCLSLKIFPFSENHPIYLCINSELISNKLIFYYGIKILNDRDLESYHQIFHKIFNNGSYRDPDSNDLIYYRKKLEPNTIQDYLKLQPQIKNGLFEIIQALFELKEKS